MGDEEVFADDDVTGGGEQELSGKTRFLPAIILKVLKWVALALAAIIFIVTVVIVTIRVLNIGADTQAMPSESQAYRSIPPIYSWFDIPEVRSRTMDATPVTVIVDIKLGYRENDRAIQNELVNRMVQIQDIIRRFFSGKSASDLSPQNEDALKRELIDRINGIMRTQGVSDVVFVEFNFIEF